MRTVKVTLEKHISSSYDIVISRDALGALEHDLMSRMPAHSYAIITDSNVEKLYGSDLYRRLSGKLPVLEMITIPAGEENKNRATKELIENRMLEKNFGRDSAVIALGGGVVGDIAGFVAATYCRGIPHIQIPTTIVSCVDSSVGGKTAVDTEYGKNLIGCFYQPWNVYIDTDMLTSLNKKELREGLAEVIKYGVIRDPELFEYLESQIDGVFEFKEDVLEHIILRSCSIKADVVEKDEKESNLRKILNFGHTAGHAIEKITSFSTSHGQAISMGMIIEGRIAEKTGLWTEEHLNRLIGLLCKAGLPTEFCFMDSAEEIINAMKLDKKTRQGNIEMALPCSIGSMAMDNTSYGIRVSEQIIKEALTS